MNRRIGIGASVGIGMLIGGVLGIALGRVALGVGIGAITGVALGYLLRSRDS